MTDETLMWLIRAAGAGHFAVVAASTGAPKVLRWKEELARLRPLNRQIFSTYAGYILTINLLFGLISIAAPQWLIDRTPLAACICGFIALYWGARLLLQFVYYDNSAAPPGFQYKLAEWVFIAHFAYFTGVFGFAGVRNLMAAP
ncbi:MAG: hypothetical protein IPK87_12800 [Planctomycetes bacterium]|nr:hypothetical protein [Planctomycetota bacterium]